jgi:hypothetical protein
MRIGRSLVLVSAMVAVSALATACQEPKPLSMEAETPSYRVAVDLDGASLGQRSATIEVTDHDRKPVTADEVELSAEMTAMDMSATNLVARQVEDGRYEVGGELFTMLGEWTLTVHIDGPGSEPAERARFTVDAKP